MMIRPAQSKETQFCLVGEHRCNIREKIQFTYISRLLHSKRMDGFFWNLNFIIFVHSYHKNAAHLLECAPYKEFVDVVRYKTICPSANSLSDM